MTLSSGQEPRSLRTLPMTPAFPPFLPVLLLFLVAAGRRGGHPRGLRQDPARAAEADNPQQAKLTPYECGAPPLQEGARHRYSVKFYLVAMLFILFDVEAAFLLPWAVQYKTHLWTFWAMLSFVATLLVGYVYVWGKGALDWER